MCNQTRMTFIRVTALITLVLATLTACGPERNIRRGDAHLALGEYFDAAEQFKQAYAKTPAKQKTERGAIALKLAGCYARINAAPKAVAAYRNAQRNGLLADGDKLCFAQQLMKIGAYREAADMFGTVSDSATNSQLARNQRSFATQATAFRKAKDRYLVKRMNTLNSRRADYSPALAGENYDRLYFTSTRNEASGSQLSGITGTKEGDIFVSEKDDRGAWSKPRPIEGALNTPADEGACTFSADGRTMYLTQCTSSATAPRYAMIVKSTRSDAAWGQPQALVISRDTLSSYAHPAVSPDGEWLYFTSDMPGGLGGLDLWRVRLTATGLGGAENLGAPINTSGNEEFPTFRPNGDLYFSSDGHPGFGGLDIFIAQTDSGGRYVVKHPGVPLNSPGDDFGMTFEGAHNRGFFSSNRDDDRGWDHLYSFEYPEVIQTLKGWVYERDGYELPAAQVYIVGSDGTNERLRVKGDGSFCQTIRPGVDYLLLATCKGFLNHQEAFRADSVTESKEYTLQFPLASITAPVLIDNIFYDFDKATLRPESARALDELVGLLQENPHVTIELSAHCDYKGSAEYNKRLSQRRAETVVDYLVAHGIARDRLTPMGYGKEKPKVVRPKLTETYPWLKVDDVLTEAFIKAQDSEHQDICNQLNRRTEFIVLRTTYGMFDDNGQLKQQSKPQRSADKSHKTEDLPIIFD
ncbi:OmpA family protein [Hoylesella enoeca]|uniref:OmpA-like domain-containing protein n=1 Tax=Hoylesella enoeca TaxID=76123 RepID=A0A0S2KN94_9BACT|nr:OmpA family protein [Hoylesella enoeca]ALO49503.1 hypothetical protein AS203_10745 [Hoylesella enoeca]